MSGPDPACDPSYLICSTRELPDAHVLDRGREALDTGEREKASRFRSPHDRRRFVWRRYLRRHVLAEALGVEPGELVFAAICPRCGSRAHGKPYLLGAPHLHFSAAQSGDHTVVATGPAPLGVDIQAPSPDLREVAHGAFTREELASFGDDHTEANRRRALLWARKEAYLKALGVGLSIDPASVDACAWGFDDGAFGPIVAAGQAPWSVASWTRNETVVAIACATPQPVGRDEVAAAADPRTGRVMIKTVKAGGHEDEMGSIYASSGASGAADLSRSR